MVECGVFLGFFENEFFLDKAQLFFGNHSDGNIRKINKKWGVNCMWMIFAILSAVFAALTSILAKVGIENVNSHLATAIRTVVVVIMAWAMVFYYPCTGWFVPN